MELKTLRRNYLGTEVKYCLLLQSGDVVSYETEAEANASLYSYKDSFWSVYILHLGRGGHSEAHCMCDSPNYAQAEYIRKLIETDMEFEL